MNFLISLETPYRINCRNHRKIIVIDGRVGFVGGINIADRYIYGTDIIPHWRGTHMKIEGEAVNSLQVVFLTDWASIMQAYFSAISTASDYIYIAVPYFIPNESILTALKTVSMSGIDVRSIIPGKTDSYFAFYGTQSYAGELLEAGIRVFSALL